MTSHPKDLSDELIGAFGELTHLMPQLHLPVQAGSDEILRRMNRRYTREHYLELVEKLREGTGLSAADVWERLAATVACKAAIKAGWESDAAELTALARRVVSGEITHCPHGRPVMQRFTRAELDKRFGRIT